MSFLGLAETSSSEADLSEPAADDVKKTPWAALLTSRCLAAVTVAFVALNWTVFLVALTLPLFVHEVLEVGMISVITVEGTF